MEGRTTSAANPLIERASVAWRQGLLDGDKVRKGAGSSDCQKWLFVAREPSDSSWNTW